MSTVKITDLPVITTINANTANTLFVGVDIPTNITGKMTLTTLAAGLYSNNSLAVGNNYTILPNVVAQFSGNSATYLQVNLENQTPSGSGDYVVTADDGTDTDYFIDLGLNGSTYSDPTYSATKAHDGYLYVAASGTNKGNLAIGTTNSGGKINFVVGGLQTSNIVGYIDSSGIWSSSINSTVAANVATLRSEITANAASANSVINTRISANVATLRGEISANAASANAVINTNITANIATANLFTQAAFDKANNALANTTGTFNGSLTITGILSTANVTINKDVVLNDGGVYQYTTANNTTVTQATSKSTAVTCNGRTGQITTNNASLAKGSSVSFTVNNSQIVSAKDVVIVNLASGGTLNSYQVSVDAVAPGSFSICIVNNGSGALAEALVINYAILRVN